jgi:hypothetical protein
VLVVGIGLFRRRHLRGDLIEAQGYAVGRLVGRRYAGACSSAPNAWQIGAITVCLT